MQQCTGVIAKPTIASSPTRQKASFLAHRTDHHCFAPGKSRPSGHGHDPPYYYAPTLAATNVNVEVAFIVREHHLISKIRLRMAAERSKHRTWNIVHTSMRNGQMGVYPRVFRPIGDIDKARLRQVAVRVSTCLKFRYDAMTICSQPMPSTPTFVFLPGTLWDETAPDGGGNAIPPFECKIARHAPANLLHICTTHHRFSPINLKIALFDHVRQHQKLVECYLHFAVQNICY